MKTFNLLFLIVFLIGCKEKQEPVTTYTIDQFYKNISVGGGSFSPDETKLLIHSNETGIYNVYEIDIATGETTQLTTSEKESFYARGYFPTDDRFVYSADKGGNENHHLYMQTTDGNSKDITPADSATNSFGGWSRDDKNIFISSNKRDAKFFDLYQKPIDSLDDVSTLGEMLYQNNEALDAEAISLDKRYIALTQSVTSADSKMYLFDRESGETIDISEHEGDVKYSPQYFNLANTELYFTTDQGSEFNYLAKMNLETKEVEKVFEAEWDLRYAYTSRNEKYQVI